VAVRTGKSPLHTKTIAGNAPVTVSAKHCPLHAVLGFLPALPCPVWRLYVIKVLGVCVNPSGCSVWRVTVIGSLRVSFLVVQEEGGMIKIRSRKRRFGFPVTMQQDDRVMYVVPDGSQGYENGGGQSDGGQSGQSDGQGVWNWGDEERAALKSLKMLDVNSFNEAAEAAFVQMLFAWLQEVGQVTVKEVLAEVAFEFDVSTETAKRYLLKHTARRAEFSVSAGKVVLK